MIQNIKNNIKIIFNYLIQNPIRNLILFGILFRTFFFLIFYTSVSIYTDTEGYVELSQLISSFNLMGYHGLRTVGYPLVISLFNQNLYLVVLFKFILGIATSIIWYKTILNLKYSIKSSFIITLFLSSFLSVFFFETSILVEALVLFMVSIMFYLISNKILDNLNIKNLIGLSTFFAFLIMIKPFYAFLPFLILLFVFFKNPCWKTILSKNLIILILPLFAYYGWCYFNKINTGYFAPTSYYGLTNAQNCVYFAEKAPKEFDWISKPYVKYREQSIKENRDVAMTIWFTIGQGAFDKYNLTFEELSFELGKFAKATIIKNPVDYLKQVVCRSWYDFWRTTLILNEEKFNSKNAENICDAIWSFQHLYLRLFKLIFIGLIPYYLYLFYKNRKVTNEFMIIVIVFANSVLQALVTYGTNNRYSYPYEFIMIIAKKYLAFWEV